MPLWDILAYTEYSNLLRELPSKENLKTFGYPGMPSQYVHKNMTRNTLESCCLRTIYLSSHVGFLPKLSRLYLENWPGWCIIQLWWCLCSCLHSQDRRLDAHSVLQPVKVLAKIQIFIPSEMISIIDIISYFRPEYLSPIFARQISSPISNIHIGKAAYPETTQNRTLIWREILTW